MLEKDVIIMRLGGYSSTNGLTLFCDVLKVKASRVNNGEVKCKLEWILPPRWLRKLGKNKHLGFLMILYYQWRAFDLKLKLLVVVALGVPLFEEVFKIPVYDRLLPTYEKAWWQLFLLIPVLIIVVPKLIKLFRYHGAEHKVINCYAQYGSVNLDLAKAAPRFNKRCGTNLVVIFLLLYSILWFFKIDSVSLTLGIFIVAIIVVKRLSEIRGEKWDKYFNMMQFFTVWEPSQKQLEVAVKAFTVLLEGHYIYQKELTK